MPRAAEKRAASSSASGHSTRRPTPSQGEIDGDSLIRDCQLDNGPILKRWDAAVHGPRQRIKRRTSHVTFVVRRNELYGSENESDDSVSGFVKTGRRSGTRKNTRGWLHEESNSEFIKKEEARARGSAGVDVERAANKAKIQHINARRESSSGKKRGACRAAKRRKVQRSRRRMRSSSHPGNPKAETNAH